MSELTAGAIPAVELDDMQALTRFGFKHLRQATFLLLRIKHRDAARAWLAAAPVTSAATVSPLPATALQVALTSEGLRALGVATDIIEGFSNEYIEGMSGNANRSKRLGDVAESDPAAWLWGAQDKVPHVLLMLYAAAADELNALEQSVRTQLATGFEVLRGLPTAALSSNEPFGFEDGISQPKLDWDRTRPMCDEPQYAYTNLACIGEFVIGYPNEYGGYTDRPLLDPLRAGAASLPRAEDAPDMADLGRNGTYLVMRQLQQHVHRFWQFLDRQAGGDAALRERLAAAMVGRTRDGEPLVGRTQERIVGVSGNPEDAVNAFTFQSDAEGLRCPLGAHIRRSNPRNADLPLGKRNFISRLIRTLGFDPQALDRDLVASTRFHRLLRRGRKYGDAVSIEQALTDAAPRNEAGLHFVCLGGNIARQFEFVQSAWLQSTKFAGLANEGDPLLGSRQPAPDGCPTNVFSMPLADGPDKRLNDIPAFVTVRGGAYFFLPGIRALRYLASVAHDKA